MIDQGLKDLEASVAAHANLELLEAENAKLRELLTRAARMIRREADIDFTQLAEIDAALREQAK